MLTNNLMLNERKHNDYLFAYLQQSAQKVCGNEFDKNRTLFHHIRDLNYDKLPTFDHHVPSLRRFQQEIFEPTPTYSKAT